ncbi:MAG: glycosyltransferase family 4 protein [Chromatiaceae bacterium]|nr:glycosyltransferase family 4 protein [Chromatiaceae bacterium]MCP5409651.1 glycosyltransferase family 4 protein [Chromatiaceae bacterium]MCP5442797.1 glycosyltransferase family 4 protein [Chromatiaceae bacterium]
MKILILGNNSDDFVGIRGELLKAMADHGHQLVLSGPAPLLPGTLEKTRTLSAEFHQIPLNPLSFNPVKEISTFLYILDRIRHIGPEMVLLLTIKPIMYGSIAARIAGVRKIYSLNSGIGRIFSLGTTKEKLLFMFIRPLLKLAFKFNTRAFFQNHDDIDLYVEKDIIEPEKAVRVNGTGIDLERFKYRKNIINGEIRVIMISRLLKEKGVDFYCQAAKKITTDYKGKVSFSLVGNFEYSKDAITRQELCKMVGEHVDYLGSTNDVRPYLIEHNIFVLPSFYREGVPRVIMEAMATGMPVITTDSVGCRDTINGKNGVLVPVKDVDSLYRAIEFFIKNTDKVETMSAEGRKFVESKFDINQVNQIMLSVMNLV